MLKSNSTTVIFSLLSFNNKAIGISKTAASIQKRPFLINLSIKLFKFKTTIYHSKSLTLQPLIFEILD